MIVNNITQLGGTILKVHIWYGIEHTRREHEKLMQDESEGSVTGRLADFDIYIFAITDGCLDCI